MAAPEKEKGGPAVTAGGFAPSVWGDYFVTYTPPISQRSEERMRERAAELKVQVRRSLENGGGPMNVADAVTFVDTLERLGVDVHFREEIEAALGRVRREAGDGLHVVALRFRLLRQHGFWVSTGVLDKFRDGTGSFSASLSTDPRALLSLYNAAHMATPGEEATLDEATRFARRHLDAAKDKLCSPMAEQVSRALVMPLPRTMKRFETMHYLAEYEQEEAHDDAVLELARIDFNLLMCLHLRELKELSVWWRNVYDAVKLNYTRDRLVETYFWTCGVFHEEEYSHARMLFAKTFALVGLVDDTYDVHATLDDCHRLNEAIQRWDESAVSVLPEYLHMYYIQLLSNFKGFEDTVWNETRNTVYITPKEGYAHYINFPQCYQPSFKEHLDVSVPSAGMMMLAVMCLMGMEDGANKEAFEWVFSVPDAINAGGQLARFLNDIAAHKRGKNKKDMISTVECYMKEHGVTGEEAMEALSAMVEGTWGTINQARMEVKPAQVLTMQMVVNLGRIMEAIYLGGRDGYTHGGDLKDLVTAFFLKPVPLS
ncbi:unnamed protein product [Alopecurus aequalis]